MDLPSEIEPVFQNQLLWLYHNTALKTNLSHSDEHKRMREILEKLPKNKLCLSNFDVSYYLGKGSYGKVYKANWLGKEVALKAVNHKQLKINDKVLSKELKFMKEVIGQKRMLQIYGSFFERNIFLVTELTQGAVCDAMPISNRDAARFSFQLLEGLTWLKSKNLVHCNINIENILIDSNNNVKFGDFGSMFRLPKGKEIVKKPYHLGTISMSHAVSIKEKMYGFRTDVFGVGLALYEAISGTSLLQANFEIPEKFEKKFYLDCFLLGRVKEKFVDDTHCAIVKHGLYVRERLTTRISRNIHNASLKNLILYLTCPGGSIDDIPLPNEALQSHLLKTSLLHHGVLDNVDNDKDTEVVIKRASTRTNDINFFPQPSLSNGATLAARVYFDAFSYIKSEHNTLPVQNFKKLVPQFSKTSAENIRLQQKPAGRSPNGTTFTCNECGKRFAFRTGLSRHMNLHKKCANLFNCSACMKVFNRSDILRKHMLTHTDEKPFACNKCSYKGKYKQVLDDHKMRKHNDIPAPR